MHFNRSGRSKGDSIGRCATVDKETGRFVFKGMRPYTGGNRSALVSKWYHPRAKIGDTYMPLAIAMQRGLVV